SEVTRQDPEEGAEDSGHDHRAEADHQRDAGSENETRQHVAAEVIGAEEIRRATALLPGGRLESQTEGADLRRVRREDLREDREDREAREDRGRDVGEAADPERREAGAEREGRRATDGTHGYAPRRMRGSMIAYSTSTTRLTTMIMVPPRMT